MADAQQTGSQLNSQISQIPSVIIFYRTSAGNIYLTTEDGIILPHKVDNKGDRLELADRKNSNLAISAGAVVIKTPLDSTKKFIPESEIICEARIVDSSVYREQFSEFKAEVTTYASKRESIDKSYRARFDAIRNEYIDKKRKTSQEYRTELSGLGIAPKALEHRIADVILTSDLGRSGY